MSSVSHETYYTIQSLAVTWCRTSKKLKGHSSLKSYASGL